MVENSGLRLMEMPNTGKKQGEESIHHFSHNHALFTTDAYGFLQCVACASRFSTNEDHLFCQRCDDFFHMHKSCAELPRKLKHTFHQQHSLTLLDERPWRKGKSVDVFCCACGKLCTRCFVYECSECEFYIHSKCAMLFPTTRLPAKHQKLRHPHPLIVCQRKIVVEPSIVDFQCGGCYQSFDNDGEIDYSTLIYVCLECHVLLHESCADLPQNLTQHPLHPNCTLTFGISSAYDEKRFEYYPRCDFCQHNSRLYFQCSVCSIKMDIPCALLTPCTTTNYKPVGEQKDNSHPHPLIHCNIPVNYDLRKCGGCYQRLEESAYYCVSCKMFLNKSCAELPQVIQHPFHPYHPLTLSYSPEYFPCSACLSADVSSFYYRCDLCKFYLHLRCASPILYPMIYMSELHQHPLAYYDKIHDKSSYYYGVYSNSTCSKCTQFFYHPGFRCLECKFDVHDHCLPLLPPTVKTKWHRHPLTLTHAPIKNEGSEEFNFYCDCCEGGRILEDPTYFCAKCHLISHVGCVMWEVMDYLQAKSTKVGELCNTKVIVIGEAKTIDNIYAASRNKDRVEQGDHQAIMNEDSDHILIGLRNEIAATHEELVEHMVKVSELSSKLEGLQKRLSDRLSQHIAYKIEFK